MNTPVPTEGPLIKTAPVTGGSFDYIIAGAGCAGLSLLMRLLQWEGAAGKQILVLDQDSKKSNDRTWCFWEQEPGFFEPVVHKEWEHLLFKSPAYSAELDIASYKYKLIRGGDFYRYCFDRLQQHDNVRFVQAKVEQVVSNEQHTYVVAGGQRYDGGFVFNSIMPKVEKLKAHHYWLLQHFKGWVVETDTDCFDPSVATLMDFRVGQEQGTTFVYVLPFSRRKALVEYTLFSKTLLPQQSYDAALKDYMHRFLGINQYRVADEEFGVIPMTNYPFAHRQHSVLHMGTAGGSTKASSGYTFRFIQKRADAILESLKQHGHPFAIKAGSGRFGFYDSVLLNVLHHNHLDGATIFSRLFERNKGFRVLKFLDNETRFPEEFKLMNSLPNLPFTAAALGHMAQQAASIFRRR